MVVVASAALAGPEVVNGDGSGPPSGASLVLLFAGEQDGRVGPCGCEAHPRGGLEALTTAARTAAADGTPSLLLNPGAWLASASLGEALDPLAVEENDRFHQALYRYRFDAFNVTYRDLPGVGSAPHPGMVSVTNQAPELPVADYKRFQVGGVDVLVTGVSRDGLPYLQPAGTVNQKPVPAVRALLDTVSADLVVVLAYDVAHDVPGLAAIPGVDVVIEAGDYPERWPPLVEESGAVWVRSAAQGKSMGELYLWVDHGVVTKAVDRRVDLAVDRR